VVLRATSYVVLRATSYVVLRATSYVVLRATSYVVLRATSYVLREPERAGYASLSQSRRLESRTTTPVARASRSAGSNSDASAS
jgi:hypothetical protein